MYVEHVTMIGERAVSEWRWLTVDRVTLPKLEDDDELAAEFDRVKAMREADAR